MAARHHMALETTVLYPNLALFLKKQSKNPNSKFRIGAYDAPGWSSPVILKSGRRYVVGNIAPTLSWRDSAQFFFASALCLPSYGAVRQISLHNVKQCCIFHSIPDGHSILYTATV